MGKKLLIDTMSCIRPTLTESSSNGRYSGSGEFARADVPTANKRIYSYRLWEREIKKLQRGIEERKVYGELDHPADGKTKLSRSALLLTSLTIDNNGIVNGNFEVIDTSMGKELKAIIDAGGAVGISSRGYGSVKMNEDGYDEVQDDYGLMTFDAVADPAQSTAYPEINKEGQKADTSVESKNPGSKAKELLDSNSDGVTKALQSETTVVNGDVPKDAVAMPDPEKDNKKEATTPEGDDSDKGEKPLVATAKQEANNTTSTDDNQINNSSGDVNKPEDKKESDKKDGDAESNQVAGDDKKASDQDKKEGDDVVPENVAVPVQNNLSEKANVNRLYGMAMDEIEREIFKGASTSEPRGFSDAFNDEEIVALLNHPDYKSWPDRFKDWLWSAVEAATDRGKAMKVKQGEVESIQIPASRIRESAEDVEKHFEDRLVIAIKEAKDQMRQQVMEEIMTDSNVAKSIAAMDNIKRILAPYVLSDDLRLGLESKDQEVKNLKARVSILENENKQMEVAVKDLGFSLYLARKLGQHPRFDKILESLGDLVEIKDLDVLKKRVAVFEEEMGGLLHAASQDRVKHVERLQAKITALESQIQNELNEKKKIEEERDQAIEYGIEAAGRSYLERRLMGMPNAPAVRKAFENIKDKTKGSIDKLVESFQTQKRNEDSDFTRIRTRLGGRASKANLVEESLQGTKIDDNNRDDCFSVVDGVQIPMKVMNRLAGLPQK